MFAIGGTAQTLVLASVHEVAPRRMEQRLSRSMDKYDTTLSPNCYPSFTGRSYRYDLPFPT